MRELMLFEIELFNKRSHVPTFSCVWTNSVLRSIHGIDFCVIMLTDRISKPGFELGVDQRRAAFRACIDGVSSDLSKYQCRYYL